MSVISRNGQRGFTIVELLIVVVVIGILAAIVIVAYNGIQRQARDTQRQNDMATITRVLGAYKVINSRYPTATSINGSWEESHEDGGQVDFMEQLRTNGAISSLVPVDPVNTSTQRYRYYRYTAGDYGCPAARGAYYVIGVIEMETSGRPHPSSPGFSCTGRDWGPEFDWVTGGYES